VGDAAGGGVGVVGVGQQLLLACELLCCKEGGEGDTEGGELGGLLELLDVRVGAVTGVCMQYGAWEWWGWAGCLLWITINSS